MIKNIDIKINSLDVTMYNTFYKNSIYSTPFHSIEFLKIINNLRNDLELYFNILYYNDSIIAVLPYFKIKKLPLSMISLPYGCYGGYLYINKDDFLKFIRLKNPLKLITNLISYDDNSYELLNLKYTISSTWLIDINIEYDLLFSNLHSKTRNQIRKANKNNINVSSISNIDELKQVELIYKELVIKHGIENPYKLELFDMLFNFSKVTNNIIFKIAKYENIVISYSVFLKNNNSIFYWLNASRSEYLKLNGTNAILNNILIFGCKSECSEFNMGAVPNDNNGLMHFKLRWNAKEKKYKNYISKLYSIIRKIR